MNSLNISENSDNQDLTSEALLRSINIVFDAEHPERIAHFFPTSKSISLLDKLISGSNSLSCFVIAPYGSGKSLLGSFYQHVIENTPAAKRTLTTVVERIRAIDSDLAQKIIDRFSNTEKRGIVVPLSGYIPDVPNAIFNGIKDSLKRQNLLEIMDDVPFEPVHNMDDLVKVLSLIREKFGTTTFDHLDIVWDEFGRHLEELVLRGDALRLNELQLLAEFSTRSKRIQMTLALFLHQGLMRYAANVPRSVSAEWKKIEARFEPIQYVDDSKEITSLAARVLQARHPDSRPSAQLLAKLAADVRTAGYFNDFSDTELEWLIASAYPVLPAALYVLPRIASRVAQNERTLFSYLFSTQSDQIVTPTEVFEYFSDLMRSDTTLGGTYHHWLETQSALKKVDKETDERIIKTLSLFSLGFSGERNRVSKVFLLTATKNYHDDDSLNSTIGTLIDRKLLLYRKNSDAVILWHANDVDLRGKIESEKTKLFNSFDLLEFLNDFLPTEDWRPIEYNIRKKMTRFYSGSYIGAREIEHKDWEAVHVAELTKQSDGIVWYVVPESDDDVSMSMQVLQDVVQDERVVALVPASSEGLFETALEAASVARLLNDNTLLSEDPLVEPELQLMLDDTQAYLMRVIDKLYTPSPDGGPNVICNGKNYKINSKHELRSLLSNCMDRIYYATPQFNNELINKRNPSKVVVNARKKFVLGIMERYGSPDLGLEGNRPDRSMFTTLFLNTDLYKESIVGRWRFCQPSEINDPHIKKTWELLEYFFADASKGTRGFNELFQSLSTQPYGIREGLFPILVAAGFRAFPSAFTLIGPDKEYIPDIKPTTIEDICKRPEQYQLTVVKIDAAEKKYLAQLESVFASPEQKKSQIETDPLRRCYDAIESWKASLPPAALFSRKFTKPALVFQKLVNKSKNPAKFFLQDLFAAYGLERTNWEKLVQHVAVWKQELESVVDHYYSSAARTITSSIQTGETTSVREAGKTWNSVLPSNLQDILNDGVTKAIVQRFQFPYDTDEALIDSLSSLLIGKKIDKWDDSTIALFDREFKNIIHRIEDEALVSSTTQDNEQIAIDLLSARLSSMYYKLTNLIGTTEAEEIISTIINSKRPQEELTHGNN